VRASALPNAKPDAHDGRNMSNEPNKIIEPSAFDKWWAEVQTWRRHRITKKSGDARRKYENYNTSRTRTVKRASKFNHTSKLAFIGLFNIIAELFLFLWMLVSGVLRFGIWIAVVAAVIWVLSYTEVEEKSGKFHLPKPTIEELKTSTDEFAKSLKEAFGTIHIEIETKDGEKIEFGTKQPEEPEQPTEKQDE
jgi:hypothetical protein